MKKTTGKQFRKYLKNLHKEPRTPHSLLMTYQGRLLREQIYCGHTRSEKKQYWRLRKLRMVAKYGKGGRPGINGGAS